MNNKIKCFLKFIWIVLIIVLAFFAWRDYNISKTYVHFHANLWVFINWKKVDFSSDKYMEDIAACKMWTLKSQKDRVHLHQNNWNTVHVHDDWVTWGHFFSNVGYNFTDNILTDDNWNNYLTWDKKLTFILNWKEIKNPFNREIVSEDILLINYWDESLEDILKNYYPEIKADAWEYNEKQDPATCSWSEFSLFHYLSEKFWHPEH